MARFAQGMLNSLTNPAFAGQLAQVGQQIGSGVPAARKVMQSRQEETAYRELMAQAQKAVASKDASALSSIASKLSQIGKQEQAMAMSQAAQKMTTAAQTEAKEAQAASEARGVQGGLAYFTQAAAKGVPFEQLQEGVKSVISQGGSAEDAFEAYQRGLPEKEDPSDRYSTVGNYIFDNWEREFLSPPEKEKAPEKTKLTFQKQGDDILALHPTTGEVVQRIKAVNPDGTTNDVNAGMNLITKTSNLIYQLDQLTDIGWSESGVVGQVSSGIGGTPALDREGRYERIRSNLGFEQINEMKREAAAAGGSGTGLGQISNIEFMALRSVVDNLGTAPSKERQLEAIQNIKRHLTVVQKLASGIAAKDAIDWDHPSYAASGYIKSGNDVFYFPNGPDGEGLVLRDGKFVGVE